VSFITQWNRKMRRLRRLPTGFLSMAGDQEKTEPVPRVAVWTFIRSGLGGGGGGGKNQGQLREPLYSSRRVQRGFNITSERSRGYGPLMRR